MTSWLFSFSRSQHATQFLMPTHTQYTMDHLKTRLFVLPESCLVLTHISSAHFLALALALLYTYNQALSFPPVSFQSWHSSCKTNHWKDGFKMFAAILAQQFFFSLCLHELHHSKGLLRTTRNNLKTFGNLAWEKMYYKSQGAFLQIFFSTSLFFVVDYTH